MSAETTTEGRELALLADGSRMLAEARGLFELRDVRSVAIAAAAYARARDLGEDAVRSASRIVVLATVRIGEEIAAGQEAGTIATVGQPSNVRGPDNTPATLADLGVDRHLASAGQRLAAHPDAVREYLAETSIPSVVGALRAAARDADREEGQLFDRLDPEGARRARVGDALAHLDKAGELIRLSRPHKADEVGKLMRKVAWVLAVCREDAGPRKLEVVADERDTSQPAEVSPPAPLTAAPDPNRIECADFRAHHASHRWSDLVGWHCLACESAGAPS